MVGSLNHMGAIIPPYATYFHNRQMPIKSEDGWMNDPEFVGRVTVQAAEATKSISRWGRIRNRPRRYAVRHDVLLTVPVLVPHLMAAFVL